MTSDELPHDGLSALQQALATVQRKALAFIPGVRGDYFNVVGYR